MRIHALLIFAILSTFCQMPSSVTSAKGSLRAITKGTDTIATYSYSNGRGGDLHTPGGPQFDSNFLYNNGQSSFDLVVQHYNSNDLLDTGLYKQHVSSVNAPAMMYRFIYTYYPGGQLSTTELQIFDTLVQSWQHLRRDLHYYYTTPMLDSCTESQEWDATNTWHGTYRRYSMYIAFPPFSTPSALGHFRTERSYDGINWQYETQGSYNYNLDFSSNLFTTKQTFLLETWNANVLVWEYKMDSSFAYYFDLTQHIPRLQSFQAITPATVGNVYIRDSVVFAYADGSNFSTITQFRNRWVLNTWQSSSLITWHLDTNRDTTSREEWRSNGAIMSLYSQDYYEYNSDRQITHHYDANTDDHYYYTASTLGLAQVPSVSALQLVIYPNPAHNVINLSATAVQDGVFTATITDIAGRSLRQWKASMIGSKYQEVLNVDALSSGIYYLTIQSATGAVTRPFYIQ